MKQFFLSFCLLFVLSASPMWANHGSVLHTWDGNHPYAIYLPDDYLTSDTYYPVCYLLHGSEDDEMAWLDKGRLAQIADSLIGIGEMKPMIIVMPLADKQMNGEFELGFGQMMSWVESHFRVQRAKSARAIAGLSMGGYYAMHITHYYNQLFDYVGLFSATYTPAYPKAKAYKSIDRDLQKQFTSAPKLYYIAIGTEDPLYQENVIYRQKLDKMKVQYEYHQSAGGHTWDNWQNYISDFLQKIFH